MGIESKVFYPVQPHKESEEGKVTIVGAGPVGISIATTLLSRKTTRNLVLVESLNDNVKGEVLDFQHASLLLDNVKVTGGKDYSLTKGSKLCILAAGFKRLENESILSLAQNNTDILVKVIPELIKYSPDTILFIVGNPCEILTYAAWKISGLPHSKVIGSGTTVDSQRFKYLLAQQFQISPSNLHAWIIGQHGGETIPLWSSVNLAGNKLKHKNPSMGLEGDLENWYKIYKQVVSSTRDIHELKEYSNWGIAMCVSTMSECILRNKMACFPVSVNGKGKHGITEDIFISLPALLGFNGVYDIVNLNLSEEELKALMKAAAAIKDIQDKLYIKGANAQCKCKRCRT